MSRLAAGGPDAAIVVGERLEREIRGKLTFLTPVFGGGVRVDSDRNRSQVKEPDRVTPVRSASVRGQLREWWRWTCGFQADGSPLPLEVLQAREAALWGWASTRDRPARGWVSVEVDGGELRRQDFPVLALNHRNRWEPSRGAGIGYGTFPLSPSNASGDLPAGTLTSWQGSFAVVLRAPPLSPVYADRAAAAWRGVADVEAAMWTEVRRAWEAWTTFGGFGARTRRGFGAVKLDGARPVDEVVASLGWNGRVAWLKGKQTYNAGPAALDAGLTRLKDFRQGPGVGRNPGQQPNRPGRSRWPEPDELRRLTRENAPEHRPEHPVRRFPRAAFGMPIIFHFKDRGDPKDQSVQPAGRDRLASPVVIRPVADGGSVRCVALRLPRRDRLDDVLADLTAGKATGTGLLTRDEQSAIRPLADHRERPESGADAVLHPFFRYFRGNDQ